MRTFKALLAAKTEAGPSLAWQELGQDELMDGDVTVAVSHTTLNYKDALALTGKAPVIRRWPMIPGIDLAGTVASSTHAEFRPGEEVLLNGWGVGETHYGGYAGMARLKGEWLIKRPPQLTPGRPWRSARRVTPPCWLCWRSSATASRPPRGRGRHRRGRRGR